MNVLVGIGAGLVSALLFGVVITGSPLAMMLCFIAPLPIFIAALGWSHRCGLIATVAGGLGLAAALTLTAGLAFALGWALPAWGLAYLALLGRPTATGMEWYPLGRLLLWIAGTAALITLIGVIAIGDGSYEGYRRVVQQLFEQFLSAREQAPAGPAPSEITSFILSALPFFFAFNFVLVLALNIWLAARAVKISERLPRPWPFIPGLAMPKIAIGLLAVSIAVSFLPGFIGTFGMALTGALLAAFALQGLVFIHDVSQARPGRPFLLSMVYVVTFLASSLVMPLLALLGLADVAFTLRNRFRSGSAGPEIPPT
jgi:hypothetical protein